MRELCEASVVGMGLVHVTARCTLLLGYQFLNQIFEGFAVESRGNYLNVLIEHVGSGEIVVIDAVTSRDIHAVRDRSEPWMEIVDRVPKRGIICR